MEYPSRNGIPVPTIELDLPPSNLDLERRENYNTHHLHFYRRWFASIAILQVMRDLERSQEIIEVDRHNELHRRYTPPEMPTELQVADNVMDAYEQGEGVRIYNIERKQYEVYPIPTQVIEEIHNNYGSYE